MIMILKTIPQHFLISIFNKVIDERHDELIKLSKKINYGTFK